MGCLRNSVSNLTQTGLLGMYAAFRKDYGRTAVIRKNVSPRCYMELIDEALDLFEEMKHAGAEPDESALIAMYASCGSMDLAADLYNEIVVACAVFDQMVEKDLVYWSAMIAGYAESDWPKEALNLFDKMQALGVKPDQVTMLSVISACSNLGALQQANWVNKYVDMNGFAGALPINNALIDMYAKCGSLERAGRIFDNMVGRNVISWTSMINAFCSSRGCSHVGLVEEGQKIFASMVSEHNVTPKQEHYGYMGALMAACRIHGEVELGDRIETSTKICESLLADRGHGQSDEIYEKLDKVVHALKSLGYATNTSDITIDLEEEEKEEEVLWHSEKLALCYGLISEKMDSCIWIVKNLRICEDCYTFLKLASRVYQMEIVVRDRSRFHYCKDGVCSCNDYL
ncbi:hypothetical protein Ancab_005703 [Ancistrocladus abbreviatus]